MKTGQYSIETALKYGYKYLSVHTTGYALPRLESELLLGFCLGRTKESLLTHYDQNIPDRTFQKFQNLLIRRGNHEPVSQILGEKEFYSRMFYVNKHVLTPRPETEILIETALKEISQVKQKELSIADLGTGSGCIAITLALEEKNKHLKIYGYDKSKYALNTAVTNWENLNSGTDNSINFQLVDLIKEVPSPEFDIIVSNPPYIPLNEQDKVAIDVIKYEPKISLFSGNDGLDFYKRIRIISQHCLNKKHGVLLLELYSPQAEKIRAIFQEEYSSNIINDLSGSPRVLVLRLKSN